MKIIYKPFPYTYKNDPITKLNKNLNDINIFEISNFESTDLMTKADLVLLDTLSTGFGEALSIKVPVIIYSNKLFNT